MAKKEKVLRYTSAEIGSAMRQFQNSPIGEVLYNLWSREREKILARGKRDHKGEDFYTLEGFDSAISVIETWAAKKQRPDAENPSED